MSIVTYQESHYVGVLDMYESIWVPVLHGLGVSVSSNTLLMSFADLETQAHVLSESSIAAEDSVFWKCYE